MRHPSEGVLRRLVDEPAGVTDADRAHVAGCPACLRGAGRPPAPTRGASTPRSRRRHRRHRRRRGLAPALGGGRDAGRRAGGPRAPRRGRWRPAAAPSRWSPRSAPSSLLAGAGAAAANDWLPIFQHRAASTPSRCTAADLVALPDLSAYGDLEVTQQPDPAAGAPTPRPRSERTGLAVPQVAAAAAGVTGDPTYQVAGQVERDVHLLGRRRPRRPRPPPARPCRPPPAGLDGSRFRLRRRPGRGRRLVAGPRACRRSSSPGSVAPTAFSSGVPFETVRDYLLSLPGLPAGLADQLRDLLRRRRDAAAARAGRAR